MRNKTESQGSTCTVVRQTGGRGCLKRALFTTDLPSRKRISFYFRSAWALVVSWVVFACALGYGGPINTLLSWRAFGPVSRINYSAYLYHLLILSIIIQNRKSTFAYDDFFMSVFYCGFLLISFGVGFLTTLLFESPFVGLEKLLFKM